MRALAVTTCLLGMGLAAGTARAALFCEEAEQGETAWLGVYLGPASEEGVTILGTVGDDSPAASIGLQDGDLIVRFNGRTVAEVAELVDLIKQSVPGQEVNLDINRDGRHMSFAVVLGSRPRKLEIISMGEGRHPGMMFHGMGMGGPGMHQLHDILKDLDLSGKVQVHVTCEDGEGRIVIEQDGEEQVHEFDCSDSDKPFNFNWEGMGDKSFSFRVPDFGRLKLPHAHGENFMFNDSSGKKFRVFGMAHNPGTRIDVAEDGRITITVNNKDAELNLRFQDAADLEQRNPELFEKYQELIEELE